MSIVLVICTANICRSPFGAYLLEDQLAATGLEPVDVRSAGTEGMVGAQACPALWTETGTPIPADHRARQVTTDMVAEADLVITLATDHRGYLAALAPESRNKTFTLAETSGLASVITAPGHALAAATGALSDLDELDPLNRVPRLPQSATDRFTWLVGEMDASRGSLNPNEELSVDDPHQVEGALHSHAAVLIQDHIRSLGESISRVMQAEAS